MSFFPSQTPTTPSKIPPNEVGKATGVHLAPLLAEMCSRLWPDDHRYWHMDRTNAIVLGEALKTLGYDARMQCCTISNTNAISRPLNLYGIHLEEGLIFADECYTSHGMQPCSASRYILPGKRPPSRRCHLHQN